MRVSRLQDIDQLLCIKGMVTRCSTIVPDLKQAFFRCCICSYSQDVMIDRGRIEEPRSCAQCQTLASMELIHNRCLFTDKQLIRLQETPDEIPAGETPHTITLFAFDDLVDTVRPGDRLEVTGIFRAVANRPNPRMRTVKSIYKTYVDAIHFRRADEAVAADGSEIPEAPSARTGAGAVAGAGNVHERDSIAHVAARQLISDLSMRLLCVALRWFACACDHRPQRCG